jgi:hypothetical protein
MLSDCPPGCTCKDSSPDGWVATVRQAFYSWCGVTASPALNAPFSRHDFQRMAAIKWCVRTGRLSDGKGTMPL